MPREKPKAQNSEHKTFSDAIGGGEFHPDLPRVEFKDILDRQVLVIDAELMEDFSSKFGEHDALLLQIAIPEEEGEFTTITSGEVVIKRVMKAKREGLLPLLGTFTKGTKTYYNIL